MRSRTERVSTTLRDMIIYMALEPGQAIREPEIMDRLHVGRTPVREALIRLSEDMLVQTYPQRGTYVTKIDMDYVAQLMKMRNVLETELLAEYAREKPQLQAQFQSNLAALELAVRSEDIVAYLKADAEFHSELFRLAGYPLIWKRLRRSHSTRYRLLDLRTNRCELGRIWEEHRRILVCLEAGDVPGLRQILRLHHDPQSVRQKELTERYPDYFGTLEEEYAQSPGLIAIF